MEKEGGVEKGRSKLMCDIRGLKRRRKEWSQINEGGKEDGEKEEEDR